MNSFAIAVMLEVVYQRDRRDDTVTRQQFAETVAYCGVFVLT